MHATLFHIALLRNGLLAGTFIGSAMMEHAARTLTANSWIAYKQAKEVTFGAVMLGFPMATIAASAALAWFSPTRLTFGVVALLLLAILVVTVVVHLPINMQIQSCGSGEVPGEWSELRSKWRERNWVRCAFAVAGFAVATLG